jgi:hypothetical protein
VPPHPYVAPAAAVGLIWSVPIAEKVGVEPGAPQTMVTAYSQIALLKLVAGVSAPLAPIRFPEEPRVAVSVVFAVIPMVSVPGDEAAVETTPRATYRIALFVP